MFLGLRKVFLRVDPTKPKYCSTWNVKTALLLFESLKLLEDLTLRQFSYKTVLLLALASAARAHELSLLDLSCSLKKESSWEFNASHISKPPGLVTQPVSFFSRKRNDLCCVYPQSCWRLTFYPTRPF